jgi:hypothetical protein
MQNEEPHNCIDIDELLTETSLNIEKFGLQVISVSGSAYLPSFSYSIGLWQTYQHPEVICFGLSTNLMHGLINDVAAIIKQGERIEAGKLYSDIFKNSSAQFLPVDPGNIDDYFGVAIKHYRHSDFPAIQLIWTDRNNKFPWEDGFEEQFVYKQPLLDRNVAFKFREAKNLGIFTTRQWLELGQPILRVVHDSDGDWQFLTGDQLPEDIKLVALEQMVQKDITLNEVFDLEYGQAAEREYVGDKWVRGEEERDDEEDLPE